MNRRSILARLEELEKRCGSNLPVVNVIYQNGDSATFYGTPPAEDMFREDNHIVRAWGSEFADMVNTLLHPVPNRNIEDFEGEIDHERKD